MEVSSKNSKLRCIIHGSFRKHFKLIQDIHQLFTENGIEVIAPRESEIVSSRQGFVFLEGEDEKDPRLVELLYLHSLKQLGGEGFSYFVNPEGYIGRSTSYELGIAQVTNVRCFFFDSLKDHPAYVHKNSIWKPADIVGYIQEKKSLPMPQIKRDEKTMHKLWEDLMVPGSVVATGGIIQYKSKKSATERQILLVKTYKWGGLYSIVGGKVKRNERLGEALIREVREETGLAGDVGAHICTFDQIKDSGYYLKGIQHIFVDNVVNVSSKRVHLNDEAEDYIWIPVKEALRGLPIEPNAKHTLELYANSIRS